MDITRIFFLISDFLGESRKAKKRKRSLILQYFSSKNLTHFAKFNSLGIENNMLLLLTLQIVTYIIAFFTPFNVVTLCQFYSITSPALFTKLHSEMKREKKIFCIYGCFTISRYIKGGRKSHL